MPPGQRPSIKTSYPQGRLPGTEEEICTPAQEFTAPPGSNTQALTVLQGSHPVLQVLPLISNKCLQELPLFQAPMVPLNLRHLQDPLLLCASPPPPQLKLQDHQAPACKRSQKRFTPESPRVPAWICGCVNSFKNRAAAVTCSSVTACFVVLN